MVELVRQPPGNGGCRFSFCAEQLLDRRRRKLPTKSVEEIFLDTVLQAT
jgi:hypothetical protein